MEATDEIVRYGNPVWTLILATFLVFALVAQAVLAVFLLVGGTEDHRSAPFVTGLIFAPLLVLEVLALLVMLVREPSRLRRVITLTPKELQLPTPKWQHVPIGDITGVSLARSTKARGSNRGTWAPTFWRSDGEHAWVGGLGFITSKADPTGTRPADIVSDVHRRIAELQGEQGPLVAGHHPELNAFGFLDRVWEPPDVDPAAPKSSQEPVD